MMASSTSNGVSKAVRKGYADLDFKFRTTPRSVATIDFGTTHCSLSYFYLNSSDVHLLQLDEAKNKRVPSCILFDKNGETVAFGYEARKHFLAVDPQQRPQFYYFQHVKKQLQHEKNIDRNRKVDAMNGKKFYLVDVIAHILHHLKCRLLRELGDLFSRRLKASEFDWVITVPAIWKSKGKKMMREAGYMGGLCSDLAPPRLCIASGIRSPPQEERSPEKLSLALEPESAAIHCRQKAVEVGRGFVVQPRSYIVVDVGGGTVDIASHAIVGGRIEEIAAPAGNSWGGTTVNEEFSEFLGMFVGDPNFSRYIESGNLEKKTRHKAELNKLLYYTFEAEKKEFGSGTTLDNYNVDFPRSFFKEYEHSLVQKGRSLNSKGDWSVQVDDDDGVMRISKLKMAEFFQPAIDGITDLIEEHLNTNNLAKTIDTIYWVGGFGGCRYLRSQLETAIKKTFSRFQYQFPVPPEPEFAVIRGATRFRCDPGIVNKRKADATYGTGCRIHFDPTLHRPTYKQWDEERQEFRCTNLFRAFVEMGEDVCTNEVFVMDFVASTSNQKRQTFTVYSAPRKDVWYTTDDEVYELGEVTVDMGGYGLDREIELVCDITHTEIQIRARDKTSGNVRKVVLDFLSSSKQVEVLSHYYDYNTSV